MAASGFAKLRRGLLDHMRDRLTDAQGFFFMYAVLRAKGVGAHAGEFSGTYREIADDLGWSSSKVQRVVQSMESYIRVRPAANQHGASTFTVLKFGSSAVPPAGQHRDSTGTAPGQHRDSRREKWDSTGTADAENGTAPPVTDRKHKASEPLRRVKKGEKGLEGREGLDVNGANAQTKHHKQGGSEIRCHFGRFGFARMTKAQTESLLDELGHQNLSDYIARFDNWVASSPDAKVGGVPKRDRQAAPTIWQWWHSDQKKEVANGISKRQQRIAADDAAIFQALAEECDDRGSDTWLSEDLSGVRRDDRPRSSQALLPIARRSG